MALDIPSAQLAATATLNLAMAAVVGASISSAWLRGGASAWAARYLGRLRVAALVATGMAILASLALLWLEAAWMAEVPLRDAAPAIRSVLEATHYGFAWTIGICALVAIAIASMPPPRGAFSLAATLVRALAISAFLYSRSIASHAGASGDASWAVAMDWLHLVLASLWVGAVLAAGFFTLRVPASSARDERLDRASYVQALSNSATFALAGIVATGLFSAWRGLGSLEHLTGNAYATALQAKLALVFAAALLGGANRFLVMPGLLADLRSNAPATGRPERRFALVLQFEAIILAAALVMAAVLSSTPPPTAG